MSTTLMFRSIPCPCLFTVSTSSLVIQVAVVGFGFAPWANRTAGPTATTIAAARSTSFRIHIPPEKPADYSASRGGCPLQRRFGLLPEGVLACGHHNVRGRGEGGRGNLRGRCFCLTQLYEQCQARNRLLRKLLFR